MLARRGKEEAFLSLAAKSLPTLLVGTTCTGKTTALEHMILCDIERGDGVAVLDMHGDLSERLLGSAPENRIDDVVYFDPGDPDFYPLWNPLKNVRNIGATADAILEAIKNEGVGWGERLEYLLRQVVLGILNLDNPTLFDVLRVLAVNDKDGKGLRDCVLAVAGNTRTRSFWEHDINTYDQSDFAPIYQRLSKALLYDTIGRMFHQSESRIDFGKLMDESMILVVDLSKVGSEVRTVLRELILRLLRVATLGRNAAPADQCKPFHIYVDDASHIQVDIVSLADSARRRRVSLTLAFQHIGQVDQRQALEAFAAVGSIVAFKVLRKDAVKLEEMLGVPVEDLVSLGIGEAIACTGNDILGMVIPLPQQRPQDKVQRDRIIQMSRQRYCRPTKEVRADLHSRNPATSSRRFMCRLIHWVRSRQVFKAASQLCAAVTRGRM